MSNAFVQISQLLSIAFSLRTSLKCLKSLSARAQSYKVKDEGPTDQLMYWVVFALLSMYEKSFEVLFRWIPYYNFAKLALIVVISIPALRITNLIFLNFHVVAVNQIQKLIDNVSQRPAHEVAMDAPFLLLLLIFPALGVAASECDSAFTQSADYLRNIDSVLSLEESSERIALGDLPQTLFESKSCDREECSSNELDSLQSAKHLMDRALSKDETDSTPSDEIRKPSAIRTDSPTVRKSEAGTTAVEAPCPMTPKSLMEAKRDTLRRLSSLTPVIRSLTPRKSPSRTTGIPTTATTAAMKTPICAGPVKVSYRTRSIESPPQAASISTSATNMRRNGSAASLNEGKSPTLLRDKIRSQTAQNASIDREKAAGNSAKCRSRSPILDGRGVRGEDIRILAEPGTKTRSLSQNVKSLFDFDLTHRPLNSAARSKRRSTLGLDTKS